MSISYDRVLEISAQLGDATVSMYVEEGLVCPPVLRKGLFTTAVMDNIDHNPSATTATTTFHGTSISVFQHPATDNHGEARQALNLRPERVKSIPELPDSFTNIAPASFKSKPTPPCGTVPVPTIVQWQWPEQYGEDKYLVMFGGFHIEMAALRSLGSLLKDSGWTGALVEAGVASSGTADSFLSVSSVTRTRQMHQVTACSLYKLLKSAYNSYCTKQTDVNEDILGFEEWCQNKSQQNVQFQFWYLVLSMQLTIFMLIRSFCEANFSLYCQALRELIPYFFANNNTHYARWLPVHLRDMMTLENKHPALAQEFMMGNFVVHKTKRDFSSLALDQAHEQANAVI